jgi:hypothetical protein
MVAKRQEDLIQVGPGSIHHFMNVKLFPHPRVFSGNFQRPGHPFSHSKSIGFSSFWTVNRLLSDS